MDEKSRKGCLLQNHITMNTNEKIHQAFNNRETVEVENIFKPNTMKQSIRKELLSHIEDCKNDFDEVTHFNMFNEDYYLIGYNNCKKGNSIVVDALLGYEFISYDGMNVTKWGPTCVTLYTFDILNKKTVGKIKYSDIKIIGKIK